jgi:hypothetical protein
MEQKRRQERRYGIVKATEKARDSRGDNLKEKRGEK